MSYYGRGYNTEEDGGRNNSNDDIGRERSSSHRRTSSSDHHSDDRHHSYDRRQNDDGHQNDDRHRRSSRDDHAYDNSRSSSSRYEQNQRDRGSNRDGRRGRSRSREHRGSEDNDGGGGVSSSNYHQSSRGRSYDDRDNHRSSSSRYDQNHHSSSTRDHHDRGSGSSSRAKSMPPSKYYEDSNGDHYGHSVKDSYGDQYQSKTDHYQSKTDHYQNKSEGGGGRAYHTDRNSSSTPSPPDRTSTTMESSDSNEENREYYGKSSGGGRSNSVRYGDNGGESNGAPPPSNSNYYGTGSRSDTYQQRSEQTNGLKSEVSQYNGERSMPTQQRSEQTFPKSEVSQYGSSDQTRSKPEVSQYGGGRSMPQDRPKPEVSQYGGGRSMPQDRPKPEVSQYGGGRSMPQDRGGQDRYGGGQDRYGGGGDRDGGRGDGGRGDGGRGDGGRNSYGGGGRGGRDFGSGMQRGGGRGGRDFGSGMQREGGRGGRGFGERGGGRGGRGRGGRAPSGIAENPTMALSNLIPTDITANFRFYLYGVDCRHKDGQQILSRRRRGELFHAGLNGLMDHYFPGQKGKREREDVERITFFEGSFFFSSRPVVGLDPKTIREIGLVGDEDSGKAYARSDNGDTCRVTGVQCFSKPEELIDDDDDEDPNAPVKKEELEMNGVKVEEGNIAGEEKKESDSDLLSRPGCLISVDFRCADCTIAFRSKGSMLSHCKALGHSPVYSLDPSEDIAIRPANIHQFLSYCNIVLQRAMSERMARWGREYIDPSSFTEPMDERSGISYGVKVFRAYSCDFGLCRFNNRQSLTLTVDLRAKVLRTKSLLDQMSGGKYDGGRQFADERSRDMVRRKWVNEQVICMYDKRTYSVIDILFDKSPATMPVSNSDPPMSHAEYFSKKKGINLEHPEAAPLIAVLGRNQSTIYLPAEVVCGNELDMKVQSRLPTIASFKPAERNDAIEEMKRFLRPGAQKTKGPGGGLLPALGIVLGEDRIMVKVDCLPLPTIIAAGVRVPNHKGKNWAPCLSQANFRVDPSTSFLLNTIVVYHQSLSQSYLKVYDRLANMVNKFQTKYRFPDQPYMAIRAGDIDGHWEAVEEYFKRDDVPDNIFVVDFTKPPRRSHTDPAYFVVKQMLGRAGYLSQFINFNVVDHASGNDRRSNTILQGTSRQILSKCGVRVWWVDIPKSVPLPAIFVGVDCFHTPRKYNPKERRRVGKESCAGVVVQLIRKIDGQELPTIELYSLTERREAGKEMDLSSIVGRAMSEALQHFKVSPMSCIVWRDGVGDAGIQQVAETEIPAVRTALETLSLEDKNGKTIVGGNNHPSGECPLAYIVCQKRISTKFLSTDGKLGMPPGAMISDLHSYEHDAFYLNGTSPPYSTPKAVRFIIAHKDKELNDVSMSGLSWAFCHDYPNWTGPIKVPSLVQMAHKLAELAGNYDDCGESMNSTRFLNKLHFL